MQIHDEVFPRLASGQLPENSNALPRLLGVTNLYFLKALPSWPNVLSTGKRTVLQRSVSDGGLQVSANLPAAAHPRLDASCPCQCMPGMLLQATARFAEPYVTCYYLRGAGPVPG